MSLSSSYSRLCQLGRTPHMLLRMLEQKRALTASEEDYAVEPGAEAVLGDRIKRGCLLDPCNKEQPLCNPSQSLAEGRGREGSNNTSAETASDE